jgi:eukaryotic-like serine/threonine-protein kinase
MLGGPRLGTRNEPSGLPLADVLPMENRENKRFGRYEIVAELGRGAMGVVYQARDPQINRLVALKTFSLFHQEPEQEEEFRQRFVYEAQAAGRLQHPGIVAVFDVGEEAESKEPFIVLEYVAGESLSRILSREKKLSLPRALNLAEEIAEALDYAHAQGVVHRDIKPANILVTQEGRAKIADFGIAKLNLAHFTLPGRLLGTPAYMAPEQLIGEAADGRSDLFSLGVILYVMVTGHSPFHGNSATTVCFKVVNREPMPASALDLDLPRALDPVISRAVAKDPAERYQRGAEFASDLRQLRTQYTGSTTGFLVPRSPVHSKLVSSRPATAAAGTERPADWLVRTILHKASIRDLILGAVLVVICISVVGIPLRKTVASQKAAVVTQAPPATDSHSVEAADFLRTDTPLVNTARFTTASEKAPTHANPKSSSHSSRSPRLPTEPVTEQRVIVASSTLELSVQHQFKEATLSVWIDDQLALTLALHGGTQKRMVVFHGVRGVGSETLQVPAGNHVLRLKAKSADQSIELSKTIAANFIGGDDKTLQITFDKHNTTMHLNWQ